MSYTRRVIGGCAGVCLLAVLCVAAYWVRFDHWIERELATGEPTASDLPYFAEIELMTIGWSSGPNDAPRTNGSSGRFHGSSLNKATSPDGCFTVFTRTFSCNHHSYLRNESTGEVTPLISIREPDPWSGSAHWHHWSADSRAVYFLGQGCDQGDERIPLPLIYLLDSDRLVRGSR